MKAKMFWITAVVALLGALRAEAAPAPAAIELPAAVCGQHDPSAPGFYG
jgi:hypothetical protein